MTKINLLFILLFSCVLNSNSLFGQFARSFYSAPSSSARNTGAFIYNGKINSVSVKESNPDSLKIMLVELDDRGISSNYRFIEMPLALGTDHNISGTAVEGNMLLLNVLYVQGSVGKAVYVLINLSNGSVTTTHIASDQFIRGFVKSEQKQDSLITYNSLSTGTIVRLSVPVNSPSNLEIENTGIPYIPTSYMTKRDYATMLIDGASEYFYFNFRLHKRTAPGSYNTSADFTTNNIFSRSITKNGNGEIILHSGNVLLKFSTDLTLLNQKNFLFSPLSLHHTYYNGQNIVSYLYYNMKYMKFILDDNLNTLDSLDNNDHIEIYGSIKFNNSSYLYGSKIEPITLNSTPFGELSPIIKSSFIVKDFNSIDVPKFSEYNQNLQFHDISFHTGHLNTMFYDESNSLAGFKLDINSQKKVLIIAAQNILIGINENGDTVGTGNRYGANTDPNSNMLLPGPFTTSSLNSHENSDKYNKGYYVDKYMIEAHYDAIENNDPSYEMPFGIEFWPGNGNPALGQADVLASFHDENGNDIYEPLLGDYPEIYGDRCFLNIYHQPENSPYSNNLEIHQYYFMFECDTNDANTHTIFVKQKYFNRSAVDIDSIYVGSFIDTDIGSYADDYAGTNVELGMMYAYNGDLNDEPNGGQIGFNDTLPALGMMMLKGPKAYNDNLDNEVGGMSNQSPNGLGYGDGIMDNEYIGLFGSVTYSSTSVYPYSDPSQFSDYIYPLKGMYVDGTNQETNDVLIRHSYFGNSDPSFYSSFGVNHGNNFSEITANNPNGDRRMMGGSGPGYLYQEDTIEFLTAYVYGIDSTMHTISAAVDNLFEHGAAIRTAYLNNELGCGSGFDPYIAGIEAIKEEDITVYPNPFNNTIKIDGVSPQATISISDMNGKLIYKDEIQNNQSIELSWLAKNVYVMQIIDGDKIYTKRIVKM